jgi:hypothetical protein
MTESYPPAEQKQASQGPAREQLEHLYRAIGISAVAAAAAQVARPETKPAKVKHEMPACLRDDDDDHLAA